MNPKIRKTDLPRGALLAQYRDRGVYTDCFCTDINGAISLPRFIEAFYSTGLFRVERWILARAVKCPSSAADLAQLASGKGQSFAAWSVEARLSHQILLRDYRGETASWLCVAPRSNTATTLCFGSAVMAGYDEETEKQQLPGSYRSLMGFHRFYSRLLLGAARRNL